VGPLYGDAQAVQSAMDAITGGLRYAGVTEEDVQAVIDAEATRIAAEATRIAAETLKAEWVSLQNDGGINAAVAAGDRAGLVAALQAATDAIGGV